jgi:hypothetical protein
MSGALTRSPPVVNDSPKDFKQRGCSMDFVDYNQLSCLSTQKCVGVLQATLVGGAFKIKVERSGLSLPGCNGPS